MGIFKKKNEELGEIPSLPELPTPKDFSLPELPKAPVETIPEIPEKAISQLPELPELKNTNQEFNHEIIKQEIANPQQTMKKSQFNQTPPIMQKIPTAPIISKPITRQKKIVKEEEPIYVRLDKFELSVKTFDEIKIKIEQIEELLKKTKEIKQKEELELEEWEREINLIKARIDSVDKTIFNQLD